MGKGQRNKDELENVLVAPQKKKKAKRSMPKWLKNTIAITVAVIIVLGIVALVLHNNGTFRRMQILIESKSGEYDVNRQVATFLAWEIEYYNAYIDFLTTDDTSLQEQYGDNVESFAHEYALARITQELKNSETGEVVSTPRDAIDNTLDYMLNFVAVCDYAYDQGITLEEDEWKGDLTITWYAGMEDALPITWDGLHEMMIVDSSYGLAYSNLDLFLDDYFDCGLNSDDVEQALKLICMYEKCLAMYSDDELAAARADDNAVSKYISDNPNFFYTVEYLSVETESVELKDALVNKEVITSPEAFKTAIAKDWFEVKGNYKDTYNAYVAMKKAEAALADIKDLVDTDENKAWTNKLTELGATQQIYSIDKKSEMNADMGKWLFAKRAQYDEELVKTDDGFYVLAAVSQALNADGDISTTTVYELKFALEDGITHEGDETFRDTIYKHMLVNTKLSSEEAPTVAYKTALENAKTAAEALKLLATSADIQAQMSNYGERFKKTISESTTDAKTAIMDVVFDGDEPVAGEILSAEESDTVAYLVYVDSVAKVEEAGEHNVVVYYVAIDSDVYYQILKELVEELEKALPTSAEAYYTANPTEGTYQHWFFAGAKVENNFQSPVAKNDVKDFESVVKDQSGVGEDTKKYTVYFVLDPLHLDNSYLVDGGYFAYTGAAADVEAKLSGKTGAELITALQSLATNSTNTATVSEAIKQSGVDEKLGDWLFSDERKANDFKAGIEGTDGKTYVAVYLGRELNWKVTGQAYLASDNVNSWLMGLLADYEVNQTVLNWIGDPTPEKETESETTAA